MVDMNKDKIILEGIPKAISRKNLSKKDYEKEYLKHLEYLRESMTPKNNVPKTV